MSFPFDLRSIKCQNQECNFVGIQRQLLTCLKTFKLICPDCSGSKFKTIN